MYISKEQRLVEALKAKKRVGNHLKQQWGIADKPPRKAIVKHTKEPGLTGVDRYILARRGSA